MSYNNNWTKELKEAYLESLQEEKALNEDLLALIDVLCEELGIDTQDLLLEFDPNRGAIGRKDPRADSFQDAKRQGLKGAKVNKHKQFDSLSVDGQTRLHAYASGRASQRGHGGGPEHDKDFETGRRAGRSPDVEQDSYLQGDARMSRELRGDYIKPIRLGTPRNTTDSLEKARLNPPIKLGTPFIKNKK